MERLQNLVRSLKTARSYNLSEDPKQAYYTLLPYVMQNQHRMFIELLESSPAFDMNFACGRSQRTLLFMAANVGAYECLLYLLKRGAKTNIPNRQGMTPIQVASRNGFVRCVVKLLENGADIEIKNNEGMTAIHWLASNGRTELITEIQRYITNVDVKDDNLQTPLHVACLNGHKSTVLKLIELGADVNMKNIWGCTPLYFACKHGHAEVVSDLLKHGAAFYQNNNGESPIDATVGGGYSRVCCALIEWDSSLLDAILLSSQSEIIDLEKIQSVLSGLMYQNCLHRDEILIFIAKAIHTEGTKLLSQSSDYTKTTQLFLKNMSLLCFLLAIDPRRDMANNQTDDARTRGDSSRYSSESLPGRIGSARSRSDASRIEKSLQEFMSEPPIAPQMNAELIGLWNILDSWMLLLQKEISLSPKSSFNNESKGTQIDSLSLLRLAASELHLSSDSLHLFRQSSRNSVDLDRLRRSQPALLFNNFHHDRSEDNENLVRNFSSEYDSSSVDYSLLSNSDPTDDSTIEGDSGIVRGSTSNSLDGFSYQTLSSETTLLIEGNGSQIVDLTADRLCCLIHGYYLHSQCQSVWKKLRGSISSFNKFIKKYEDVLLLLVSKKPRLIFEFFSFILENPLLLQQFLPAIHSQPLKERQQWFYERLHEKKFSANHNEDFVLNVARGSLLETSCKELFDKNDLYLKESLAIHFDGEEGMGTGVTREWFNLLVKEILNPDCALFTLSSDGSTFQPNCHSSVNPDHLSYFHFAGKVMGLALYHKHLITAYFARSFYKHILGIPVNYSDVESIDPEYSKNLQWILDNTIDGLGLDITFAIETDVFGQTQEVELKPNGKCILVNDENKYEYVYLAADLRMTKSIKEQMLAFLKGFYEFIPHSLASLFNEYELELMMSGVPDIDVEDWMKNTTYQAGFSEESPTIKWFWEIVAGFSQEEQIQLLQFVTGTSRVPWGGFSNLSGGRGSLFTISRADGNSMLPTASTCFNFLKLPEYTSKEEMEKKLRIAVTCGNVGFEFT